MKFEHTSVMNFENAFRGMRNPMNSWAQSDSYDQTHLRNDGLVDTEYVIGEKDMELAKKLIKAGSDHRKFLRQILVSVDITAPLYWVAEHDTYKIGTTRNSCSFMHKGVSKPFEITDFSIEDKRAYEILCPIKHNTCPILYPYETNEFKIYEQENGRKYKIFRNGKIVSCEFEYVDNYGSGRTRRFSERVCLPSINNNGYYELSIGGRTGEKWLVHRLVASVWNENIENYDTVNHIDGNKGNNSVENLEWCSREENIKKAYQLGLYSKNKLHKGYQAWKYGHCIVPPDIKMEIKRLHNNGKSKKEIADIFGISQKALDNIIYISPCADNELFQYVYIWEKLIDKLNSLREMYIETKDINVFREIRQLLPQGYNVQFTWQGNYEVLHNMYHSRKDHKLTEWSEYFCDWVKTLPYADELIICELGNKE